MNYVYDRALGGAIKVFAADDTGEVVATFSGDEKGIFGFGIFCAGLERHSEVSLLCARTGVYVIGSIDQLVAV